MTQPVKQVRKRVQTWPMRYVNQGTIIKGQNELLLLDLLIDYSHLKRGDALRLKKDLPELKELIGSIYEAAEAVDGTSTPKPGNLPVWADISRRICTDYPGAYTRLSGMEKKLSSEKPSGHLLREILKELILVTNKVIEIHFDILRIPIPKPLPAQGQDGQGLTEEAPTILDINSLKLLRNSGDFKTPGA